jgi:uncharacterized protein (TIGR00375 family)
VRYYADLHVHSKYSRACSRDCDLTHLAWWARRKGITVLGTGDVTHPAWAEELTTSLVPAEDGLFRLRDDLDRDVLRTLPPTCHGEVRFQLEVEISTIYKRDDRTRKVHHLCHLPDFAAMRRFTEALAKIGNLGSDGRPILGLDSRDLLEITLESGGGAYLVPAHAWTPWFAVLGSKSGFDAVEDCYADLAGHVFAVETGLSSDPEMNWQVSRLDRFRLVSNSDAHSPPALGRNATVLDTPLGFTELRTALRTGAGYVGTVDMFPEEGKYHHDGHRKCGVRMVPSETKAHQGLCPECGKPLTVGVLHRIAELADRAPGERPPTAGEFHHTLALPEVIGEILGVGPKSKKVMAAVDDVVATLGPELPVLLDLPLDEIERARNPLLTEAVSRLRSGKVHADAGYDGEYGVITVFEPGELNAAAPGLFDVATPAKPVATPRQAPAPVAAVPSPAPAPVVTGLDPDQAAAAARVHGPLLIVAGPGTGKTRTLTHRLASIVIDHGVAPSQCLAITFTRRAAEEMRTRLVDLLRERADGLTVATFHRLGLDLLRERHDAVGLPADFEVADEARRLAVLRSVAPGATLEAISKTKRTGAPDDVAELYDKALHQEGLVDFDDLLVLPVKLLESNPSLMETYRARYRWICVDEYQDVDDLQYRLLRLLCAADGNLCAIGDPDQAIYAFRGADVGFFLRFRQDYPTAEVVALTRNYRSSEAIVHSALAAIAPTSLVPDRALIPMRDKPSDASTVVIRSTSDTEAEARFVVQTIEELLGGSSFHAHDSGKVTGADGVGGGLSFDDIAILYRAGHQAVPLMAALAREGLPFQRRSHDRLRDHPGVRAVLPHMRPEPSTLSMVRSAINAVPHAPDDLFALLKPLADKHPGDPEAFLAELALGSEVDTWDPRADRISLLTLHAAKGLEFPVVFIVGCADGMLPLRWPGDQSGDDEERRLFFVGITRAQSHLYLSHAERDERKGQLRPSPFLRQLDGKYAKRTKAEKQQKRPAQLRLL